MKRVLVTGASGFLGRPCLPLLLAAGYQVHAVSSRGGNAENESLIWHTADLLDPVQTTRLIAEVQPTHLLHLAWCHTVPGKFWTDDNNFRWVQASLTLLQEFAVHGGERVVTAGTCAEYDWNYGYCSEEHTPLHPATIYGTCKHSLQLLQSVYAAHTGLSSAWGRLFFLYGPHEYSEKLVAHVINSLLAGRPARCSSGEQIRDFLHIEDAASAFVALLNSNIIGPANIASGEPIAVKDVVLAIGEILGRTDLIQLGVRPSSATEPQVLFADVKRLQDKVAWSSQKSLRQGLEQTIAWWRKGSACQ